MRNTALPSLLGQKLKTIRAEHGLTQDEFCAALGEKPSKIRDIESGRQRVNDEFLAKLVKRFPIDLNWLFDTGGFGGAGKPRIDPPDPGRPLGGDFVAGGEDFNLIRRYEVSASAGPGRLARSDSVVEQIAFSRTWLMRQHLAADLCGLLTADGDSMMPLIPNGALLLVDFRPDNLPRAGIYVVRLGDDVLVKRVIPLDRDVIGHPTRIMLESMNPAYAPHTIEGIEINAFKAIGKVVWWGYTVKE